MIREKWYFPKHSDKEIHLDLDFSETGIPNPGLNDYRMCPVIFKDVMKYSQALM